MGRNTEGYCELASTSGEGKGEKKVGKAKQESARAHQELTVVHFCIYQRTCRCEHNNALLSENKTYLF